MQRHAPIVLLQPHALVIGEQSIGAEPLRSRGPQGQVKPPAMDAHLRHRVTAGSPTRLGVNELAEAVEEAAFAVLDALGGQRLAQAERRELAHGVRQQRDAHAELSNDRRALVHVTADSALVQREGQGQPADTTADDRDLHRAWRPYPAYSPLPPAWRWAKLSVSRCWVKAP